jgi:hypothetical protein
VLRRCSYVVREVHGKMVRAGVLVLYSNHDCLNGQALSSRASSA